MRDRVPRTRRKPAAPLMWLDPLSRRRPRLRPGKLSAFGRMGAGWRPEPGESVLLFPQQARVDSQLLRACCAAGWVVFNWSAILRQIALSYVPLPVGDYWRVVQDYSKVKQLHLQVLWRQHNE